MKCQNCGHEYPGTLTRCTRCKQINPTKAQKSQSKLLEFPPRPRAAVEKESPQAKVPAWRTEVSERVRAAKAKRNGSYSSPDDIEDNLTPTSIGEKAIPATRQVESGVGTPASLSSGAGAATGIARPSTAPVETDSQTSASNNSISRPTSTVVEAALTRARRASENANRAMLPRIGPSSQSSAKPAITHDREATARAIEIDLENKPLEDSTPEKIPAKESRPLHIQDTQVETVSLPSQRVYDYEQSYSVSEIEAEAEMAVPEIEPRDYLAEEVRKVSHHDTDFEGAVGLSTHMLINMADLTVLILSCAPFLASMMLAGADTVTSQTLSATALVALVVSFFYFAVTQSLCGKTFGMMITRTRTVSIETGEPLSIQQSLIRTVGYFISLLPALLGFLSIALNSQRRGLHDILAGSIVVRDSESL